VQRGAFGACLMAEPALVRDCVQAMSDAVALPITVKHRIGLGRDESYDMVRDFVGTVSRGGARTFIVHARNAWLEGLSPRANREVPPLRYQVIERLRADFPALRFVLNGGIETVGDAVRHLQRADGVMLGRAPYQNPWLLSAVDRAVYGVEGPASDRRQVIERLREYAERIAARGVPIRAVLRHALGLFNGLPGARRWRRMLSDGALLQREGPRVIDTAARGIDDAQPPFERAAALSAVV
jgi:tRNA-dihydrouridine synthase A